MALAHAVCAACWSDTGLVISAGVGCNKLMAKLGSASAKWPRPIITSRGEKGGNALDYDSSDTDGSQRHSPGGDLECHTLGGGVGVGGAGQGRQDRTKEDRTGQGKKGQGKAGQGRCGATSPAGSWG